jgi:hypothetical protein
MHNIFNKVITENSPNFKKVLPIQVQKASKAPNSLEQNRTSSWYIIIKTISTESTERILKTITEKKQIMYKGKPIKIKDFSIETLKARRISSEVFQHQMKIISVLGYSTQQNYHSTYKEQ